MTHLTSGCSVFVAVCVVVASCHVLSRLCFVPQGQATFGLAQFGRQALVGGNYGLLQEHSFEPNPGSLHCRCMEALQLALALDRSGGDTLLLPLLTHAWD